MEIFTDIPFNFDYDTFCDLIHLSSYENLTARVQKLLDRALPRIKPKAIYRIAYIDERSDSTVKIGGVQFTSKVLSANLKEIERVFPYIATCGYELENLKISSSDFMVPFWLDSLKEMALKAAIEFLKSHIEQAHRLGQFSSMNPGSGDVHVWPIEQQKELFTLFGDVKAHIGVQLTQSCLMIPGKSVSGILFESKIRFESCQVCTRENCPRRRAPSGLMRRM